MSYRRYFKRGCKKSENKIVEKGGKNMTKHELNRIAKIAEEVRLWPADVDKLIEELRSVQESFKLTQTEGYFDKIGKDHIKRFFIGTVCV